MSDNNDSIEEHPPEPVIIEIDDSGSDDQVEVLKPGRKVARIWTDYTDEPDAHKASSGKTAVCKHCKETVTHHNKTASVETHLKRCKVFQSLMNRTALMDQINQNGIVHPGNARHL
jgi:hypothetical protein